MAIKILGPGPPEYRMDISLQLSNIHSSSWIHFSPHKCSSSSGNKGSRICATHNKIESAELDPITMSPRIATWPTGLRSFHYTTPSFLCKFFFYTWRVLLHGEQEYSYLRVKFTSDSLTYPYSHLYT